MITIRPFDKADLLHVQQVIFGYETYEQYVVSWHERPEGATFQLQLITLPSPYVKRFALEDPAYYTGIVHAGLSLAAIDGHERLVALALAEAQAWNHSFWIREFHVRPGCQGRGIGRQLMAAMQEQARAAGARTVVCETQNTNVPAIRFYRHMGFRIEAVDLSLYSNTDWPDHEVALLMKCRLA